MTQIKAVIFDMDGLMLNTEPIYYRANQKTADYLGMNFSFDIYSQFIGMGDADYKKTMGKLYKDEEDLNTFFEKSKIVLEYLLMNDEVEIKEGLIELLDYLKNNGIMTIVASSSNRYIIDHLLQRLDLQKYFNAVVGGDEVSFGKPNPAIFDKAFEKTGLSDKKQALILEDSKNGVEAAVAASIPVIMIPDLIKPDKDLERKVLSVLPSLWELIPYLEQRNRE